MPWDFFNPAKAEICVEFSPATPKIDSVQLSATARHIPKLPKNLLDIVKSKYLNSLEEIKEVK